MIYLASPYSHEDPAVKLKRYYQAKEATAHFFKRGYPVISPIVSSHNLDVDHGCGSNWETWAEIDRALIAASDEVWVLMLDGWTESAGIEAEVTFAHGFGIPIKCVEMPV